MLSEKCRTLPFNTFRTGITETVGESAETIVRQLKKTPKPESRSKIIAELRNLEKRRLELLDQMDNLVKSKHEIEG